MEVHYNSYEAKELVENDMGARVNEIVRWKLRLLIVAARWFEPRPGHAEIDGRVLSQFLINLKGTRVGLVKTRTKCLRKDLRQ